MPAASPSLPTPPEENPYVLANVPGFFKHFSRTHVQRQYLNFRSIRSIEYGQALSLCFPVRVGDHTNPKENEREWSPSNKPEEPHELGGKPLAKQARGKIILQGSLQHTPEYCLVNICKWWCPFFSWWKKPCFNWSKMHLLRSPVLHSS